MTVFATATGGRKGGGIKEGRKEEGREGREDIVSRFSFVVGGGRGRLSERTQDVRSRVRARLLPCERPSPPRIPVRKIGARKPERALVRGQTVDRLHYSKKDSAFCEVG